MSTCGLYRIACKQSGNYVYHLLLSPWCVYLLLVIPQISPNYFVLEIKCFVLVTEKQRRGCELGLLFVACDLPCCWTVPPVRLLHLILTKLDMNIT